MKEITKKTIKEVLFSTLIFVISFFLGWVIVIIIYPVMSPIVESGSDFPFYRFMNTIIVHFGLTLIIFFFAISSRKRFNRLKKTHPTIYISLLLILLLVLFGLLMLLIIKTRSFL